MNSKTHTAEHGLDKARTLLDAGEPQRALEVLSKLDRAPWVENARGVCLMRLGHAEKAVPIYRMLLLSGGVTLREDAPETFKANFATALMLSGNIDGGLAVLGELGKSTNPAVARLRQTVAQWRKSLNPARRLLSLLGVSPQKPMVLDYPPGEA